MDPITLHNQGVSLREAERYEEALAAFERAERAGSRAPETRVMQAHVLADLGRLDQAAARYRTVLAAHPDMIPAHEALSRLLPEMGDGQEALASYRQALALRPENGMLWVSALSAAKALRHPEQLLEWARAATARFGSDSMVHVFAANALSSLGRDGEARDLLLATIVQEPDYAPAHATLAHVLLRLGDWKAAERPALEATRLSPQDQAGWSLLTVIWRLLDDPREAWLADYDRFVQSACVPDVDWPALAANLTRRHVNREHPGDQSLRGGSQTRGALFNSPDPLLQNVMRQISDVVQASLTGLGREDGHPFLGRNTRRIAFSGSWSVRLRNEGFHISHIHPEGWLSSALYISLPEGVGDGDAGALAFGVPDAALNLDLPPRRVIRPRVGQLAIFPSYFWHGTLPFHADQPRLTIAFDAVPA